MTFVFFEFGTLVCRYRIFQRQRMQAELVAQAGDGLAVGRAQLDPDETVGLADMIADIAELDCLDIRIAEKKAVDVGPLR